MAVASPVAFSFFFLISCLYNDRGVLEPLQTFRLWMFFLKFLFEFFTLSSGDFPWQLTEFVIGVFLQVLGLPFVAVAQVSLFSKVTSEKTQGGNKDTSTPVTSEAAFTSNDG